MKLVKVGHRPHLISVSMLLVVAFGCDFGWAQEPITLISSETNVRVDRRVLTPSDFGRAGQDWKITKSTLHGGKQEGVDLVTIDNGSIQIRIVPTRGMNIFDVRDSKTGDRLLGWDSPVQGIVHPRLIDLESRGGLGWLEGFNEWMVRCGLEFAGHPGTDEFVNNTGDTATMDLTLHGKIGNIPASEVVVSVGDDDRITVSGIVYESFFYGPKLRLSAEVSTQPGSRTFRISDQITNLGAESQEFQIIYHANFGAPLLEAGAKVNVAAKRLQPMNDQAAKAIDTYSAYKAPTKGFIEEVFLIEPNADSDGRTTAVLQNASGTSGAAMSWSLSELPYLTVWKNTAAIQDGYVTGIEPATGYPFNRKVERKFGRVPKLDPGQTREFEIDVQILDTAAAVKAANQLVDKLQDAQPTEVVATPPNTGD